MGKSACDPLPECEPFEYRRVPPPEAPAENGDTLLTGVESPFTVVRIMAGPKVKVAVAIDPEVEAAVRAVAVKTNASFSSVVNGMLAECTMGDKTIMKMLGNEGVMEVMLNAMRSPAILQCIQEAVGRKVEGDTVADAFDQMKAASAPYVPGRTRNLNKAKQRRR